MRIIVSSISIERLFNNSIGDKEDFDFNFLMHQVSFSKAFEFDATFSTDMPEILGRRRKGDN